MKHLPPKTRDDSEIRCVYCGKPKADFLGPFALVVSDEMGVGFHEACLLESRSRRLRQEAEGAFV